jgi:hypothetical protein
MVDMEQEVKGLRALQRRAIEVQAQAKLASDFFLEELQKVRKRINEGETTGDPVRDYVITRMSGFGRELEEIFHEANRRLKGRIGEFALARFTYRRMLRSGSNPLYKPQESFALGVLNADALIIERDPKTKVLSCRLPVGNQITENMHGNEFFMGIPHNFDLGLMRAGSIEGFTDHFVIGDTEVMQWMTQNYPHMNMQNIALQLGKLLLVPEEE